MFPIGVHVRHRNPLHNDWDVEPAYSLVLSKILNRAFQKILQGQAIAGPDYRINLASITGADNEPDPLKFIQLYAPTIRSLLATYEFVETGGTFETVNHDFRWRNSLVLDLNCGLDLQLSCDPNSFADLSKVAIIYGDGVRTPVSVSLRTDEEENVLLPLDQVLRARILNPGTPWYRDNWTMSGDGTVPLISSMEQFVADDRVKLKPFMHIKHTDLVGYEAAQKYMLQVLGRPQNTDIITETDSGIISGASLLNIMSVIHDPIEGFLIDGVGRRLGYSAETGPVTEIPGSIWFGEADGAGWIFAPVQEPVSLQLNGIGENYYVMVNADEQDKQGGVVVSGTLGTGESLTEMIPLKPKTIGVEINQAPSQSDPAGTPEIALKVNFTEPIDVSTFATTDLTISSTTRGTLVPVIREVRPHDGTSFSILISGMEGVGTVKVSLDTSKVTDRFGNLNSASISLDNTVFYKRLITTSFRSIAAHDGWILRIHQKIAIPVSL